MFRPVSCPTSVAMSTAVVLTASERLSVAVALMAADLIFLPMERL